MTQSGTLGIFSSREQEYEQKAQLLKRLAYVIFCSEIDQYAKYMPEIQGTIFTQIEAKHLTDNSIFFIPSRTTNNKFKTERTWHPGPSVYVFPSNSYKNEPPPCHEPLANHHQRDAASVFADRAGIEQ